MNYEFFLESIQMDAVNQIENYEIGMQSLLEEISYEVLVEGNEQPSAIKHLKALVTRMIEAIKDFFKKALAKFRSFFTKEKDPMNEVEKFLEKHPEHKNKKVKIPDIRKSEKDVDSSISILSRMKAKLARGKTDKRDMEELQSLKKGAKIAMIAVPIITAIGIVGNSIRKSKKVEKETLEQIKAFSSTYPLVISSHFAKVDSLGKSYSDQEGKERFDYALNTYRDRFETHPEVEEQYVTDISSSIVMVNSRHLNFLDKAVGTILGFPKQFGRKAELTMTKGMDTASNLVNKADRLDPDGIRKTLSSEVVNTTYNEKLPYRDILRDAQDFFK